MSKIIEQIVGHVDDLKDGEMKEVGFHQRKILLSRIHGKYYATSHLCTHYKINLSKGVLSADGRLTCPWHGACFHVQTGDLEDAPGIDALVKFNIRIENSQIVASIEENALNENKRESSTCDSITSAVSVVILGGGPSGFAAAIALRQEGFRGVVTLVSKENHLPIDRVKLSKDFSCTLDNLLLKKQSYYDLRKIVTMLDTTATFVDPIEKYVLLDNGQKLAYDFLVIAIGSVARSLPIPGIDGKNIFPIRNFQDTHEIDKAMKSISQPKVVNIGSSFIGMECAASLTKMAEKITVIGAETTPFQRVLGVEVGQSIQNLHISHGVEFRMEASVKSIELDKDNNTVVAVILQNNERIPADIVIIGVGAKPATDFLKSCNGIQLDADGGISVNEFMQISQYDHIFAVGDIARMPFHQENIRVEHWNVAQQQGRIAGKNIARIVGGKEKLGYSTIPFFWTSQFGKSFRYCGHATSFDQVHIEGDLSLVNYIAYYSRNGLIVAVLSVGRDPATAKASELMRAGMMPSLDEIVSGKSWMDIKVPDNSTLSESNENTNVGGKCSVM